MSASSSPVPVDDDGKHDSALVAGLATLAVDDESSPRPTINGHHNQNSHRTMLPFVDPGLVVQKRKHPSETWLSDFVSPTSAPAGAYSPLSQAVKKLLPERTACRLGCKGAKCKYERSDYWRPEQMAIDGIFSNWITDSILACSRPTVRHSDLKRLFYDAGIRAIFNLESPDEHVFCGHGNHESGFSYNPSEFMDVGIFVYNYAMEDYGTVNVETILDIMKVMSYAMKQGKVAVHCHAGLGRTGFVICSYLVYEYRMTAHESIHYIRAKRPGSVQMTKQIEAVEEYERFLLPKRPVFTDCADLNDDLPLETHLKNQQAFIHGRDAYIFKYIPRVLFVCAARLIGLCTGYLIDSILVTVNRRRNATPVFVRANVETFTEEEKATWLDFAPSFFYEHEHLLHHDFNSSKQIMHCLCLSINSDFLSSDQQMKISAWKQKINKTNSGIDEVFEETDPCVISALMWNWLKLLKDPVLTDEDLLLFTMPEVEQPMLILEKLKKIQRGTIELLAKMFAYMRPFTVHNEDRLFIHCVVHLLTHRPLTDTLELKKLTNTDGQLRLFLISDKADYQSVRRQPRSVVTNTVSLSALTREFMEAMIVFFIGVADTFKQS